MPARRRTRKLSGASNLPDAESRKTVVVKPRPTLSRRRRWLFRLTVMIVAPVLFFAVLEAGLRLGSYGYPTTFLVGPDANGIYTSNRQFGWRFFPPPVARKPVPCFLSAKATGAIRVFILGSSAAQGIPDPSFSFGRILEVLLRERYPDVKFEVVNAAITAINSHVVLEVARDCVAHQPDLFVVYTGNNEVVGPYGPGSVFKQWSPSLKFIRANIWLKSMRIGQLLGNTMDRFRPHGDSFKEWRGMEMFMGNTVPADDPRLVAVYDDFRQNLIDVCRVGRHAGVGVILSTMAVNLKDCPPLASQHGSDLSLEDLTKWKSIYQAGVELEAKKQWPEAIEKYEAAVRIDGHYAELSYRLGRCLVALDRNAEARDRFSEARDLDVLRFRADSRLNAIIREVAAEQEAAGVRFVDAEQSLAKSDLAVGGILGEGVFFEHVHFTFGGNYLLARAVLEQVDAALPQLAASRKQEPILSREQCAEALALTPWGEYQLAEQITEMTSRPPFTNQLDYAVRQASAVKETERLRRLASTQHALRAACATYEAALEKAPDDYHLQFGLVKLALASGQFDVATEHLQILRKKALWEPMVYNDLGNIAQSCGRMDEALSYYQKAVQVDPRCAMAHSNLGVALNGRGRVDDAIVEYQKALEIDPKYLLAHNNLGNSLRSRGRLDEAIAEYQKVLEIDPAFPQAHYNLGIALGNCGRLDEAADHYQKALKVDPKLVTAHNNLGIILRKRGKLDEAIAQFRRALEIDSRFASAHCNLGVALACCKQLDEAIVHFRAALEIDPGNAEARANLEKTVEIRDYGAARQ